MEKQPLETTKDNGLQVAQPQTPDQLIVLALQNNASIDTLERLVALMERNQARVAKKEFDLALSCFQEEVPVITKNRAGWGYKYADLAQIEKIIKPIKAKHGFSHKYKYATIPAPDGGNLPWVQVTCILSHIAGHSEETTLQGPPDLSENKDGKATKNPLQSGGSAVTYLERYSLKGALGLTTANEDTDGRNTNAANPPQQRKDLTVDNEENSKEFGKILVGVISRKGKAKIADIEKHYILTDEQKAKIELANKSAGEPATKPK